MTLLQRLLKSRRRHRETNQMPGRVRRRIYRELLALRDEEERVKTLLELPTRPRLCVVDEDKVAMLRPRDRPIVHLDTEMQRASEDRRKENEERRKQG